MDRIAVLDFGGQYSHLIANRIRRLGVYSEIVDCATPAEGLRQFRGFILSGGPKSVTDPAHPRFDAALLDLGAPVLGLCYGHQLIAQTLGGAVERGAVREYGVAHLTIVKDDSFFAGLDRTQRIWMSHGDTVKRLPGGFVVLGTTPDCPTAAVRHSVKAIYGLQFHPEVTDTVNGMRMLDNFVTLCGCRREWNPRTYIRSIEDDVRRRCGDRKVFMLVSGGVDSSVAFLLLNTVLGPQRVLGLHIDNGLMRKDESDDVMRYMREHGFDNLRVVDASQEFLDALAGVADPEEKRRIIGRRFITVQEQALGRLGLNADEWILGQGTIYPDTIESAGTARADRIKTHHNRVDVVVRLIEKGLVVEPLAQLYKDEVRELGEALGLPRTLVWRHPFPGPGLGVRVLCSDGRVETPAGRIIADARAIAAGTGFSVEVLPVRSVGVQGDERTYAYPALVSGTGSWDALEALSTAITNRVSGINRIVYNLGDSASAHAPVAAYITKERLDLLRLVDHLVTTELRNSGEYDAISQMPVVLLPLVDDTGGQCVVLRPVATQDYMTARFKPLKDSTVRAIVEGARAIPGIGDIFIDITHKPPATIEWE